MTFSEVTNRLRNLAESYHAGSVPISRDPDGDPGFIVTYLELDAVTFAAAFLSVFVEALEDSV